jgi:plasmid maintenance system killer protein
MTALELAFDKKSLRQVCENEDRAKHDFGVKVAEKLKRRLADLRAAKTVKDLVAGRPHELDDPHFGQIGVELCEGYRIVFCANHSSIPMLKPNRVDWSKVSRIKVLRVENCHD